MDAENLMVQVVDAAGAVIWAHGNVNGQRCGVSNSAYLADGTLTAVNGALQLAVEQVRGESGRSHNVD